MEAGRQSWERGGGGVGEPVGGFQGFQRLTGIINTTSFFLPFLPKSLETEMNEKQLVPIKSVKCKVTLALRYTDPGEGEESVDGQLQ